MDREYVDFPNGFVSWTETYAEIVSVMTSDFVEEETNFRDQVNGMFGIYEKARDWAFEFEQLNRGRGWDGEWIDEVFQFAHDKVREVCELKKS